MWKAFLAALGPKLDFVYWQALFAPAGTPEAVIKTLNGALQKTVADPAIVKAWAAQDVSVSRRSSARRRRLKRCCAAKSRAGAR